MTLPSLPGRDRDRIISMLNLLASDKSGEVAAAGAALIRTLRARGWSWSDLIVAPGARRNRARERDEVHEESGAAFFGWSGRKSTARARFAAHADSPRTAAPVSQGLARAEPARAVRARGRGVRAVPAPAWDGASVPAGRAVVRSAKRDLAR